MKITVTASEIMDSGRWSEFCDATGINPWAVNEGLMESSQEFELSLDLAHKIGLLPESKTVAPPPLDITPSTRLCDG